MDITITSDSGIDIATILGEIDGKTAPEVQEKILPLIKAEGKLLLDMTGVPYMSSAGLRMLLSTYRQITAQKARLVLSGLSEEIRDTMSMTGFLHHFTVCDTLDAAKAALA
ncbi:MAG: anti-sigma factor antagonist [Ignavibacteriae bacterium]|nr:anti-sigma factor antagonist [Ignavibacteriota bacterium]